MNKQKEIGPVIAVITINEDKYGNEVTDVSYIDFRDIIMCTVINEPSSEYEHVVSAILKGNLNITITSIANTKIEDSSDKVFEVIEWYSYWKKRTEPFITYN